MARGFGTGFGVGATDRVTTTLTSHNTQRTVACWHYTNQASGGTQRIWEKRTTGAQVEVFFDGRQYERQWSGANGQWSISGRLTNAWQHTLIAYDSGSTANNPVAYVNGASATVARLNAPSGTPSTNTDPYVVGNRGAGDRGLIGMASDLAIWDRILTTNEAAAVYAEGPSAVPDYVLWLPLWGNDSPEPEWRQTAAAGATVTGTAQRNHPPAISRAWRWWRAAGFDAVSAVPLLLSGSISGVGSASGALQVSRLLAGATAGLGSVTGAAEIRRLLAGNVSGLGATEAALRIERLLAGSADGAGDVAGSLEIRRLLTGLLAGAGSAAGELEIARHLAGAVAGVGTVEAELLVSRLLAGAVFGTGTLTGELLILRALLVYIATFGQLPKPLADLAAALKPAAEVWCATKPVGAVTQAAKPAGELGFDIKPLAGWGN